MEIGDERVAPATAGLGPVASGARNVRLGYADHLEAVIAALAVFVSSRLPLYLLAYFLPGLIPPSADRPISFLGAFLRWDGNWYYSIASGGYQWPGTNAVQSNIAFFPLYPLAGRTVGLAIGNLHLGLFLVSNVCFAIALYLLYRLVRLDYEPAVARRAITYLAVFPTAFYFTAFYSESLFLTLCVASVYCARKGWWWPAAVLAGLSTATRLQGLVLLAPLAYEYVRQRGLTRGIVALGLVPAGFVAYAIQIWRITGSPFSMFEVMWAWRRITTMPWDTLRLAYQTLWRTLDDYRHAIAVVDFSLLVLFLLLSIVVLWKLPRVHAAYAIPAMLMIASTSLPPTNGLGLVIPSASRYLLAVFPAFIALGIAGRLRFVHQLILTSSTVLMAVMSIYYFAQIWVE